MKASQVKPFDLCTIEFVHGAPEELSGLDEAMPVDLTLPEHGLAHYRVSGHPIGELAARAAERCLAAAGAAPDLLLYVSEDDTRMPASLAGIADRLGLPDVAYLSLSGHDCGNLGPALRTAGDLLDSGRHERIMLITADRALPGERVMRNGMSVFSDGAVACLVTRQEQSTSGPRFRVASITTRTDFRAVPAEQAMLAKAELAAACVAGLPDGAGARLRDFQHVVFGNYRVSAQRFLTAAMGLPADRLLLGAIADLGHCSGDLPVTLRQRADDGSVRVGDRVLASAIGPYSWSLLDLERLHD
jgi:3-oxoacyl-[acyl-carrier-protein] synthase-3